MNVMPKTGGNTFHGSFVVPVLEHVAARRATTTTSCRRQARASRAVAQPVRRRLRARRSDQEGQALVLRSWPLPMAAARRYRHVRQRQRGQSRTPGPYVPDPALQARNDSSTIANGLRLTWQITQKQQAQSVLGSNRAATARPGSAPRRAGVPRESGRLDRRRHVATAIAPEGGVSATPRRSASSRRPGPTRCRARRCSSSVTAATAAAGAGRSSPGNPTQDFIQVREQGGAIPGSLLSRDQHAVRHGFATRPAGSWRTRGTRTSRTSRARTTSSSATTASTTTTTSSRTTPTLRDGVPVQQRRAEPVLGALRHVREPVADRVRRVLRPGLVDGEPAHVQGARALRARVELLPRVVHRRHAVHPASRRSPASRTARTSRISCRASAPPTTCSATAGHR